MPDSKYYLALCVGAGWLAGIWLGAQLKPLLWPWLLIAALAILATIAWWRVGRLGLVLAVLAAMSLGAARSVAALPSADGRSTANFYDAGRVVAYGLVASEPVVRDTHIQLQVDLVSVVAGGQSVPVQDTILVRAPRFPALPYGASVRLAGELTATDAASSTGYAAYLARQGIRSQMAYPQVVVLATGGGNTFYRGLLGFKERARAAIERSLPEPQASLLVGILLGDDSGLPRTIAEAFRRTGMTHIIAISGFNIALLIALADRLTLPVLPRRAGALVIMAFIAVYAVLVGGAASVVRAALMGGVYLFALRYLGRPALAAASLLLTALVMTAVQPYTLWDIGFQLSFAATLGLMLFAGPWTRRLQRRAGPAVAQLVGEGLVVTVAAQVFALPLILYYFGQLSLISLPANLLVLPAQPGVMLAGSVTTLAGMLAPLAGQVTGWVAWLFLAYTTEMVEMLAAVPWASVPWQLGVPGLLATYAAVAVATIAARRGESVKERLPTAPRLGGWALLGTSLALALLAGLWAASRPDGRLHVAFLDVGQGDAILIVTPSGRQVLVDGGRYPSVVLDELGQHIPFWDRDLDLVVATHPDDDHVAGLVAVLDRYDVGLLLGNGTPPGTDAAYSVLLETAASRGATLRTAQPGDVLRLDDRVELTILHPKADFQSDQSNERSIVARLAYGELTLLLTGDADASVEQMLMDGGLPLSSTVLKVGHHGSNGSSSAEFLGQVRPQVAVIAAGQDNKFGHPHPDVLSRLQDAGATILRTDESGTLELISDGRRMWWQGER